MVHKMAKFIILLIFWLHLPMVSLKRKLHFGDCPAVDVLKNFDYKKMLGTWYVIQRTRTSSSCITYEFIMYEDGTKNLIESFRPFGIKIFSGTGRFTQEGSLKVPESENPGKMMLSMTVAPLLLPVETDFEIMDTDYSTYAAIWSCQKLFLGHLQTAIILSRKSTLEQSIINKLRDKFSYYGINKHSLSIVSQAECPYVICREDIDTKEPDITKPMSSTEASIVTAETAEIDLRNRNITTTTKAPLPINGPSETSSTATATLEAETEASSRVTITTAPETSSTVTTTIAPETSSTVTTTIAPETSSTVTTTIAPETSSTVTTTIAPETSSTVTTTIAPETTSTSATTIQSEVPTVLTPEVSSRSEEETKSPEVNAETTGLSEISNHDSTQMDTRPTGATYTDAATPLDDGYGPIN